MEQVNIDPIKQLIADYKELIKTNGLKDELYKWELLLKYFGRPSLDAENFAEDIQGINFDNLIYYNAKTVIKNISTKKPEEYRQCIRNLFDESENLQDRISKFDIDIESLFREIETDENLYHNHDERTISLLLTFHDPFNYTFFKNSFYQKYCKLIGVQPKKKGEKYVHYLGLIDELIKHYLVEDKELQSLISSFLDNDKCFADLNDMILAQDILYTQLEKKNSINAANFKAVIAEVKRVCEEDDSENLFVFGNPTNKYVWIKDKKGIIGDLIAHYEISLDKVKGKYTVDIHFEGKEKYQKEQFKQIVDNLTDELIPFTWQGSKSIRYGNGIPLEEPDLINKLINQLVFLEITLGDQIRNIISLNNTQMVSPKLKIEQLNQILYGPPGTGKTYNTINKAIEIINPDFDLKQDRKLIKKEFERLLNDGQIVFTTFHQSMSYEDFIEGIKPLTVDNEVIYEIKSGVFKLLCEQASAKVISSDNFEQVFKKLLEEIKKSDGKLILESIVHSKEFTIYENSKGNLRFHANTDKRYEGVIKKDIIEHYLKTGETLDWPSYVKAVGAFLVAKYNYTKEELLVDKKYVLIIDEINRGNVSQIFGELITLIEEDKRLGNSETLEVMLPYSKEKFGVPPNLYIIGTMNTADRSVEALDAALRRRFSFIEMLPKPELIKTHGKADDGMIGKIDLVKLLTAINKRIEILLDKDHQIGHSYFMSVSDINELKSAFQNKIIPLLQEYFFGDYGKIGLVLGAGFVTVEKNTDNKKLFADFSEYDASDFSERLIYKIVNVEDESFDIQAAIITLLNN
ncbi:MAG: McrB family protein [Bacteroidia bacterium]